MRRVRYASGAMKFTLLAASVLSLFPASLLAHDCGHNSGYCFSAACGFHRVKIVLWPGGAPLAHGTARATPEAVHLPSGGAGPHASVIVMPGGGYTHLVVEQEGAYEARWLAAHGVTAFVLEYRLAPAYMFPAPMLDASRAIRYVRAHAAELGVKPDAIGIWGFSAGGHLSGYMATVHKAGDAKAEDPLDRVSDRPDFAIMSYGAADDGPVCAHGGTQPLKTLVGEHPTQAEMMRWTQSSTSPPIPALCSCTRRPGDKTVDSRNAAEFYIALKAAGIPAELHIFEFGRAWDAYGRRREGSGGAARESATDRRLDATAWVDAGADTVTALWGNTKASVSPKTV